MNPRLRSQILDAAVAGLLGHVDVDRVPAGRQCRVGVVASEGDLYRVVAEAVQAVLGVCPASGPAIRGRPRCCCRPGRCGLVFPRTFYSWRRERTDRFVAAANEHMRGLIISGVLRQTAEGSATAEHSVSAEVILLYSALTDMIDELKPRNRAIWRMTLEGYSRGEISEQLEVKLSDVDNALYTFRTRVKALRKAGKLTVPPVVEAEWERSRKLDAVTNGAAW